MFYRHSKAKQSADLSIILSEERGEIYHLKEYGSYHLCSLNPLPKIFDLVYPNI